MIAATAIASILTFLAAFSLFGVRRAAGQTLATTRHALAELSNRRLDDDTLERTAREASIRLFTGSVSLGIRGAAALLLASLPIGLAQYAGIASGSDIVAFLSAWPALGFMAALLAAAYLLERSGWRST
jgi:hypothetical protein